MPRRKRNYLPGMPYHVVQRGNNRERCFYGADDYAAYLDLWREKSRWYGVDVHAYCLMPNHIHFIVTAAEGDAISNTMKVVGSRYAYHFNRRHRRTGTLWEGRHRPSLIDADAYLLRCYRYVELNPVRARLVTRPTDYPWSSYVLNASIGPSWLVPHAVYVSLGSTDGSRTEAYRALFANPVGDDFLTLVRRSTQYSYPVGDDSFRKRIETRFGVDLGYTARGRPSRKPAEKLVKV